jgi:hypothetical protein
MIVYVDDDYDTLLSLLEHSERNLFVAASPDDERTLESLFSKAKDADLWLFDFFLEPEAPSTGSQNELNILRENGLSIFQKWRHAVQDARPFTALISSDLEKAVGQSPRFERRHILAERIGVEWVADKTGADLRQIIALYNAARELRLQCDQWQEGTPYLRFLATEVLKLPHCGWSRSAERQIDRARPPLSSHMPSSYAKAREILSWLLAKVLPYASFLLTERQAAVRIGVSLETFRTLNAAEKANSLSMQLAGAQYIGPLNSFHGARWWRAGIDHLVWEASQGGLSYTDFLVSKADGQELIFLTQADPVVVYDADLIETDEIAESTDCVRAQDEDFPADADPAWVKCSDLEGDRNLAAKVFLEDKISAGIEE